MVSEPLLNSLSHGNGAMGTGNVVGQSLWPLTTYLVLQELISRSTALWPSNVSANGFSPPWYMPLTQFETIFLCLVMFKIAVLRWIEVLPINLNNLFHGDPSGRRKRSPGIESGSTSICKEKDFLLIESIFLLIRRLDDEDCFRNTLCLITNDRKRQKRKFKLPPEFTKAISAFTEKRLNLVKRKLSCSPGSSNAVGNLNGNVQQTNGSVLQAFAGALDLGMPGDIFTENVTLCREHFHKCPLTPDDTVYYVNLFVTDY